MAKKEKYTLRNLFLPRLRGRPIREIIAIIMLNPIVWLIEAGAWFFFGFIGVLQAKEVAPDAAIGVILVATIAVVVFPLIYLLVIWLMDFFEREPLRFIFALFMWGVASTVGSYIFNTVLGTFVTLIFGNVIGNIGTGVMIAPIVEETMKGLGLILIAGHHEMDDTMDGIVYGFAVGIGFAAVENFIYFSVAFQEGHSTAMSFLSFVLYRSVICMIGHGCFTATTGLVMGYMKGRGRLSKYSQFFGFIGLLGAMTLHGIFNFMAIVQGAVQYTVFEGIDYPVPLFHGPLILLMGAIYFVIIILALWESYARVKREKAYQTHRQERRERRAREKAGDKYCPHCEAELSPDSVFCKSCGKRM